MGDKQQLWFKAGDLISFTEGEYGGFEVIALLVARKGLDLKALAVEYQQVAGGNYGFCEDLRGYPGWLVGEGYCVPVGENTVYLGSVGYWDKSFGFPEYPRKPVSPEDRFSAEELTDAFSSALANARDNMGERMEVEWDD